MAYEQKDNTGSIFKNERKETDNHPDRSGSCMIDGKQYWVSGWIKVSETKGQWLSLAFKPKGEQAKPSAAARPEMDDEVPF